uniref:Uncharacterized protein n=1 Tax=Rhipicephalus sanguineus TaxID=34632 RepID=A0A9D4SLK2_RHISA
MKAAGAAGAAGVAGAAAVGAAAAGPGTKAGANRSGGSAGQTPVPTDPAAQRARAPERLVPRPEQGMLVQVPAPVGPALLRAAQAAVRVAPVPTSVILRPLGSPSYGWFSASLRCRHRARNRHHRLQRWGRGVHPGHRDLGAERTADERRREEDSEGRSAEDRTVESLDPEGDGEEHDSETENVIPKTEGHGTPTGTTPRASAISNRVSVCSSSSRMRPPSAR